MNDRYRPHPPQRAFHREAARFAALAAGVRGGKTHAAAREFCRRIYRDRARKSGELRYWAIAPTFDIGKVQRRELFDAIGGLGSPLVLAWKASLRELHLHGGIVVEFKTGHKAERLVAAGVDGEWLDEAARFNPEAWRGGLRQRLSDRAGWALFSTTPLGRNWFYDDIVSKAWGDPDSGVAPDPEYSCHTWRTVDNIYIPDVAREVEQARRDLPEAFFRREYEASFDAFIGQIYEFHRASHVVSDWPGTDGRIEETRYGVDWGTHNPGTIVVLQRDSTGQWCVVDESYHAGELDDFWVSEAVRLKGKYGDGTFICDPSNPGPIMIPKLRRAGLKVSGANNEVLPGIRTVGALVHRGDGSPRLVFHRRAARSIAEMSAYRWRENTAKEEPVKERDHTCDAIRYALHTTPHKAAYW